MRPSVGLGKSNSKPVWIVGLGFSGINKSVELVWDISGKNPSAKLVSGNQVKTQ